MDDVARLPASDRRDLFLAAAAKREVPREIIEKDFWVCWTLKRLFEPSGPGIALIFKGGTSLSKVYGVIDRFSEDVDLSYNRQDLGFPSDVEDLTSRQIRRTIKKLNKHCAEAIETKLLPQLTKAFISVLEVRSPKQWLLELDPDDQEQQALLFRYPSETKHGQADQAAYIRPVVRLELGARSDHFPAERRRITSYAADVLPEQFQEPSCEVIAMSAERTFWEKATILHRLYYRERKAFPDRCARHYYDVVQLCKKEVGKKALANTGLLRVVAEHKMTFFYDKAARYELATPGSLRLVPPEHRLSELKTDYQHMDELVFGKLPDFETLIGNLKETENAINNQAASKPESK